MRYWMIVVFGLAAVSMIGGCTDSTVGTAEGTVKLPTGPLTAGSVNFYHPETGFSITAPIQSDGSFKVKTSKGEWIPVGEYQIAVVPDAFPVTKGTEVLVDPRSAVAVRAAQRVPIPLKYRLTATSQLKATVKPGKNPPLELMLTP